MISLSIFLFVTFLVAFLGGSVFVHDIRNPANRLFLAWTICAVIWMSANYLENVDALSLPVRDAFLRIDFGVAGIGALFILLFALRFVGRQPQRRAVVAMALPAALLAIAASGSFIVQGVHLAANGEIKYVAGPLYDAYAVILLGYFVASTVLLLYRRHASPPALRAQRAIVAIGLISTTLVSMTVNLLFQNTWPADLLRVGIYGFLFFIISVAWSITRHEFLRVRFVAVEIMFLGILSTLLTRTILSRDSMEIVINMTSFVILLVLGFALVRSFLNEERQRRELQVLSDNLAAANEQLKAMDDLKSEFISIASHQLRTPISVMKGYLSLLLDGAYGPQPKAASEKIEHMYEMNERLVQMVSNMLNVSRMEKSRLDYICATADVGAVAAEAVDEMRLKARQNKVALAFDRPDLPTQAYVDKEKIMEVFTNLLDNAIKYSPKGGTVAATVVPYRKGGEVMVTISDQGIGMNKDQASKLFQKYYRVKSDATASIAGTGLGLYVCRMFVEGMGGRIWIDKTAPGKGTTFAFLLPTRPKQKCALPPGKTQSVTGTA